MEMRNTARKCLMLLNKLTLQVVIKIVGPVSPQLNEKNVSGTGLLSSPGFQVTIFASHCLY